MSNARYSIQSLDKQCAEESAHLHLTIPRGIPVQVEKGSGFLDQLPPEPKDTA